MTDMPMTCCDPAGQEMPPARHPEWHERKMVWIYWSTQPDGTGERRDVNVRLLTEQASILAGMREAESIWKNHPFMVKASLRTLDGDLRELHAETLVTLASGYSLLWHHLIKRVDV